ncbi:hypothetical protein RB213_010905, partial [Colletotrichum asianum]
MFQTVPPSWLSLTLERMVRSCKSTNNSPRQQSLAQLTVQLRSHMIDSHPFKRGRGLALRISKEACPCGVQMANLGVLSLRLVVQLRSLASHWLTYLSDNAKSSPSHRIRLDRSVPAPTNL